MGREFYPPKPLLGQEASIDSHRMTDHETRCWGAKPYDGCCDLFGLAEASDWHPRHHRFDNVWVVVLRDGDRHRCVDHSRADRVNTNPLGGILERRGSRQADDSVLTCGIRTSSF